MSGSRAFSVALTSPTRPQIYSSAAAELLGTNIDLDDARAFFFRIKLAIRKIRAERAVSFPSDCRAGPGDEGKAAGLSYHRRLCCRVIHVNNTRSLPCSRSRRGACLMAILS